MRLTKEPPYDMGEDVGDDKEKRTWKLTRLFVWGVTKQDYEPIATN